MLIIFAFNILFWMFFEQAGSSFTFLAENIVDRDLGWMDVPDRWFQSVNSSRSSLLAPVIAMDVGRAGQAANPSIPRKFGLGLIVQRRWPSCC